MVGVFYFQLFWNSIFIYKQIIIVMAERNFEFPTEVIELPSKGLVYPQGHPLSKGTVEIKYMTAREEDILASQNLIKKGIVLDKLFESVVVEPGVSVNDIFIGDKNAILLATRILGYGKDYEVEITDPFTLEKQKVVIDLAKVQTKDIDEKLLNSENRYTFKLPKSGKEIVFKLLTHGDELEISKDVQALERINKNSAVAFDVTTRFRYMIQSVDGNEDKGFITKWIQNGFLALDTQAFRKYVKEITPDLDLKFEFTSDLTGEVEALDIPFGINFFYPTI
jgi:hypothetical protein